MNSRTLRRMHTLAAFIAAAALGAAVLLAGCTSDSENGVGADLVVPRIDSLLVPLTLDNPSGLGNLVIADEAVPHDESQLLIFGRQGSEESAILARWDFAAIRQEWIDEYGEDELPDFSAENIRDLYLRLYFMDGAGTFVRDDTTVVYPVKSVRIYELAEELDPSLYPSSTLPAVTNLLGQTPEAGEGISTKCNPRIDLSASRFRSWWTANYHTGIMIRERPDAYTDDGFTAVASGENVYGYRDPCEDLEGTVRALTLSVQLWALPSWVEGETILMAATMDVSTLHALEPVPADLGAGFSMRTHLRSYPFFDFSLDALPDNILVNRAELWLGLDTESSYGAIGSLVLAELDSSFAALAAEPQTLAALAEAVTAITGRTSFDPRDEDNGILRLNVTPSVQRHVNGLLDEPFRFLLAAGEDFFPAYDTSSKDPDYSLTRLNFYGTSAPDSLRPRLKILYSVLGDLSGGER